MDCLPQQSFVGFVKIHGHLVQPIVVQYVVFYDDTLPQETERIEDHVGIALIHFLDVRVTQERPESRESRESRVLQVIQVIQDLRELRGPQDLQE